MRSSKRRNDESNSCRPELTRAVVLVWIALLLSSVGAAEGGVLIREPQAITY